MKFLLRLSLLNSICLFTVASFFPGLIISQQFIHLLYSGFALTLVNLLIKPIIKLFLLPLNLLTLGLFHWISNVISLFIFTKIVNYIQIISFISPVINKADFIIPSFSVNFIVSLIISSLLLSIFFNLLDWLLTQE